MLACKYCKRQKIAGKRIIAFSSVFVFSSESNTREWLSQLVFKSHISIINSSAFWILKVLYISVIFIVTSVICFSQFVQVLAKREEEWRMTTTISSALSQLPPVTPQPLLWTSLFKKIRSVLKLPNRLGQSWANSLDNLEINVSMQIGSTNSQFTWLDIWIEISWKFV